MLNGNPLTAKLLSIQLIDGIVRISRILELHKAEAPLEVDVPDAAVALEEPLHVLLPGGGVQPPDEHAAAAHGCGRVTRCAAGPGRGGAVDAVDRKSVV